MKDRKLFQAKDSNGYLHYIDNLDKKKIRTDKTEFFCPHCRQGVMPRMGEKRVWHFAHIDKPCDKLTSQSDPEADGNKKTKDIWSFTTKYKVGSDFKIDPDSYQCEFCKKIKSKKYGIKWSEKIYLCKECYRQLDSDMIEQLQWKSM